MQPSNRRSGFRNAHSRDVRELSTTRGLMRTRRIAISQSSNVSVYAIFDILNVFVIMKTSMHTSLIALGSDPFRVTNAICHLVLRIKA